MEKSGPSSLLQNPYYFCESGSEASWKEVADAIGEGLHKAGKIGDPTPKTLPENLYGDVFADCKYPEPTAPALWGQCVRYPQSIDVFSIVIVRGLH